MPQRHSKNRINGANFTYEERQLATYGTNKAKLGKDSFRKFEHCCLCLQAVLDPMICEKGHLYCKECIYSSLLTQKKKLKKQRKLYEKQRKKLLKEQEQQKQIEQEQQISEFRKLETNVIQDSIVASSYSSSNNNNNNENDNKSEGLKNNFWLPSQTPETANEKLKKPPKYPICPEGGHSLRLKQLTTVNFTLINERDLTEDDDYVRQEDNYQCPVCCKQLTNNLKAYVLKNCGCVICKKCIDTVVKKDTEPSCYVCNTKILPNDLIKISTSGTGYSSKSNIIAKKFTVGAVF
eukprot:TRINITY_DN411_c0_g1_i1.p1 TRINITY_DN411_c0_g1~~TRINITY_DN411_c0_g1_i1.p1  ORF type:complete len:293 (+),score=90.49 TRINITY_DN411_c0_g1_i1:193-1071(+)